jgi:hypothetical protein
LKAADLTEKEIQMANSPAKREQNSNGLAFAICSLPFAI